MRELIFLTIANHLPRLKVSDRIRYKILSWAGLKISGLCTIWGPVTIRPIGGARNIFIGKGVFINTDVRFAAPVDSIIIGKNVAIGPRVSFETVNHSLNYVDGVGRSTFTCPIIVEDEAWIGAGSIVTQGVTIGKGSVVAAGSVDTKNIPPYCVFGGVPAELIKAISDQSSITPSKPHD